MTDYTYAVINENGIVENIISADNPDAATPLKLLFENKYQIILETEETGVAYIGGDFFDSQLRPPKTFESWIWSSQDKKWLAPVEYPQDDKVYSWDENTISWVEIPTSGEEELWQSQ